ncbi:MAG: HEAT repeat domain-containing protein [Verrucomicrobiota bacterium]
MRLTIIVCFALTGLLLAQEPESRLDRLTRWLRSPRASIREEAVTELDTVPINSALPLLLSALSDSSTVVRAAAASSLARTADKRAVPALRPLLKDDDEHVRAAAVWALCHTAGKAILPDVLSMCLDDASGIVRFRAVWGLAFIGDKSALPVAVAALGDYNTAVRERSALLALDVLADGTIGDRLVKQAKNIFPPTRRIVMYLFTRYGDAKQAGLALQAGLKDGEPLVRAEAALALGRRHAKNVVPFLLPALQDDDDHVRGAAAHALGLLGEPSSREALRPLLQDEAAFVRAVAAESLQQLGDQTIKPPAGFRAADLFTYPIYSPENAQRYR